ncbi:NAD-dependent epimerase/dehydratase family protein [Ammoniphilus resinae]|uniref:Nucleoside-diphosphate-sugar epimerase n=1 Tax=Ammoniphilus resinae TaxID=861532 RepID=A0ABS4GWD6_9BACL|nr:nucleoside-diphosphate-sugar epimerase [Ammoniphilus resinae]
MILVTGGFGMIGSNLVKRLAEEGKEIILFDRVIDPQSDFFKGCSNIYYEGGDITNPFQLTALFSKYRIETIVHSAANLNGMYCKANPTDAFQTNTVGTLNLLELARIYGVNKFLYVGSGSVFGTQTSTDPIYESTLATPMNTYASTKRVSEELVHCYRVNYGIQGVNLRVSWVFGPLPELREPRWNTGPIAYYTWKVITENRLVEESGLDFIANFTFVDDVVDGICRAIEVDNPPAYLHLSSEQLYSNREIIEFLSMKCPEAEIKIGEGMDPFVQQAPLRGPLVSEYKEQIGFRPRADFKESLEKYYNWMCAELKKKEIEHA